MARISCSRARIMSNLEWTDWLLAINGKITDRTFLKNSKCWLSRKFHNFEGSKSQFEEEYKFFSPFDEMLIQRFVMNWVAWFISNTHNTTYSWLHLQRTLISSVVLQSILAYHSWMVENAKSIQSHFPLQ